VRREGERVRELLSNVLIAAVCIGCVRHYTEPELTEPHAVVRVRVVRHDWAGPELDESVRLDGYAIAMPPAGPSASTRALRVRAEPVRWEFSTTFFHQEQHTVPHMVTDRYPCGTQSFGRISSTRYCTRSRMEMRTVTRRVVDASCRGSALHVPAPGAAYLVQYDFFAHERCTVRCMRQHPMPNGEFRLVACGAGEEIPIALDPPSPSSGLGNP
jgi:hypothetical protein